jgi:hypothetical protein
MRKREDGVGKKPEGRPGPVHSAPPLTVGPAMPYRYALLRHSMKFRADLRALQEAVHAAFPRQPNVVYLRGGGVALQLPSTTRGHRAAFRRAANLAEAICDKWNLRALTLADIIGSDAPDLANPETLVGRFWYIRGRPAIVITNLIIDDVSALAIFGAFDDRGRVSLTIDPLYPWDQLEPLIRRWFTLHAAPDPTLRKARDLTAYLDVLHGVEKAGIVSTARRRFPDEFPPGQPSSRAGDKHRAYQRTLDTLRRARALIRQLETLAEGRTSRGKRPQK